MVGKTGLSISRLATIQIFPSAYSRVYSQFMMSGMIKVPTILAKNVTANTLASISLIHFYDFLHFMVV
jgi:hypothetical protein